MINKTGFELRKTLDRIFYLTCQPILRTRYSETSYRMGYQHEKWKTYLIESAISDDIMLPDVDYVYKIMQKDLQTTVLDDLFIIRINDEDVKLSNIYRRLREVVRETLDTTYRVHVSFENWACTKYGKSSLLINHDVSGKFCHHQDQINDIIEAFEVCMIDIVVQIQRDRK